MSGENKVAKRRLSEMTFEHTGAHCALVSKDQGGPANGVTTIIFKSTKDITDQQVASQIALIEKAKLNSQVRKELEDAVKSKFQDDEWLYLEDFDDSRVFFWRENSLYVANYRMDRNEQYIVEDMATSVEKDWFYVETGKVLLSEEAKDKLEDGEFVLVNKALNNPETNSRVVKALADFTEKKEKMQEEIQKAVAAKEAENTTLRAELDSLKEIVKAAEVEKKANVLKAREVAVAAVLNVGAVELVKSTEALSDEGFAEILKALGVQKAAIEQSDLMVQTSDANAGEAQEVNTTAEIIKARYAVKQ